MPLTNLFRKIANALDGNKPGMFGACVPRNAVLDLDALLKSQLTRAHASKSRSVPPDVRQGWFETHGKSEEKPFWIGVLDHHPSVLEAFLGARGFINTYPDKSACLVVVGAWNVVEVIKNWPAHGSAFEAHHFEFCEGLTTESIKVIFDKSLPKDLRQAQAFAELIREETGGQQWLFDPLVSILQSHNPPDLAVALRNLHRSPSINDGIECRRNSLSESQKTLLENLLERRVLRVTSREKMPDALELWLLGLARFRGGAPDHAILNLTEFYLISPAPVVERCLRHDKKMLLASPAVSAAIQPLLFDFENRLRDFAASSMAKIFGPEWELKLHKITAEKAHADGESDEVEDLVKNFLRKSGLIVSDSAGEVLPERPKKATLYDVVSKTQTRLGELHENPTTGVSYLSFLTFAELASVLTHKDWYEACFKPVFQPLTAKTLRAKLDEVAQIRNAVAHHYPLKFSQLVDAQKLINELLDRMALRV